MALLRAELSTDIATLAIDHGAPHAGDDPDQFMLWASSMIWSLPTRSHGDDNGKSLIARATPCAQRTASNRSALKDFGVWHRMLDRSQMPWAAAPKTAANDYTKQALDRYYVETIKGDQKHYDDYQRRSLVFTANDRSITSKRDDLDTIKAIVAQAELRGWQTVELKGTTEFRREAWIETRTRGIKPRGYKPSEPDRQEADPDEPGRTGARSDERAEECGRSSRRAAIIVRSQGGLFS